MQSVQCIIDGIKCYHPDVSDDHADFSTAHFKALVAIENKHFWFQARNRIITAQVRKYCQAKDSQFCEIGCGTGNVLAALSKLPNLVLTGAELHVHGLSYAKQRLPQANFVQLDAKRFPYVNYFDAIGAFDVLEHIDEHALIVQKIHAGLKNGGLFFITVPQHTWLWSQQDVAAGHKRRYTRQALVDLLESHGFVIEYISSFVFVLLPVMFLSRCRYKLLGRKKDIQTEANAYDYNELHQTRLFNNVFSCMMRIDEGLIKKGWQLPVGGSLLAVARRK